jgi:hypothetical protein
LSAPLLVAALIPAATITSGLTVLMMAPLAVILTVAGNHIIDHQVATWSSAPMAGPREHC